MQDLIGKSFKYKGLPDDMSARVAKIDESYVYFEDKGKVPKNKFQDLFEEARSIAYNPIVPSISDDLDPSTFFDKPMIAADKLTIMADQFLNKGKAEIGIPDNHQFNQVNSRVPDTDNYVSPYGSDNAVVKKIHIGEDGADRVERVENSSGHVITSSSSAVFDKVRKSVPLKIKLEIDEMIPPAANVIMLNDMFEGESFIDHLSSHISKKLLNNPIILQRLIKIQIEEAVFGKPKKTKKPIKKKPIAKPRKSKIDESKVIKGSPIVIKENKSDQPE
jgi:hypothetical protein